MLILGLRGHAPLAATPSAIPTNTVVLSEFMAANTRTVADEDKSFEDWIELRNTGSNTVNLAGWKLTDRPRPSRPWLFPSTNLPAGGHLLVWASGKNRRTPGQPLHTDFRLASDGERLALLRPDGSVATDFGAPYPRQWPDASFGFLPGATTAVYFLDPTPGRANELTSQRPGPPIAAVTSSPTTPGVADALTISATLVPAAATVTNVTLLWRSMFGPESALPLTAGVGGQWSGTLPAGTAGAGRMIRWRITARDSAGGTSSYPIATDPKRTSKYLGTVIEAGKGTQGTRLPVFHFFLAPRDVAGADTETGVRGCVFHDGEFYDNVFVKLRGNSTAAFPKRSHRVEFPLDHPLRHPGPGGRIRHTSFLAEWGDPTYLRQHLSFWLQAETGSAAPFHEPVRLQLNGEFWQLAMHSQPLGEELLARYGLDPHGALYKAVGTLEPGYNSTGGFEKKTRRQENDRDYLELARALHESRNLEARRRALFERMNLPATINYLAVARLTQEDDDVWANMSLYHDIDGTDEWRPIPFDMNVSWGLSFAQGGILANRDAFRSHPFFGAADSGMTQGYNRLYDAVVRVPDTRAMLLRRMRTVLDGWWLPPDAPHGTSALERHLRRMTLLIGFDAALDRAQWGNPWNVSGNPAPADALDAGVRDLVEKFIEPRRRHLYVTHGVESAGLRRRLGITSRDVAGIPPAQPAEARLEFVSIQFPTNRPGLGFVRLTNSQPYAVDVSGWSLTGRVEFAFAPGTVVSSQATVDVAADLRSLRGQRRITPTEAARLIVGHYRTRPGKESILLKDARGRLVATAELAPTASTQPAPP